MYFTSCSQATTVQLHSLRANSVVWKFFVVKNFYGSMNPRKFMKRIFLKAKLFQEQYGYLARVVQREDVYRPLDYGNSISIAFIMWLSNARHLLSNFRLPDGRINVDSGSSDLGSDSVLITCRAAPLATIHKKWRVENYFVVENFRGQAATTKYF